MSLEKKQKQLRDAEKDTVVHDGRILYEELKQISLTNKISLRDHHQYAIGHENQNSQIYFLKCSGNSWHHFGYQREVEGMNENFSENLKEKNKEMKK